MSLDGSYDENNPFALILRGDLPSHCIYEDDATFAFLDIMPQTRGHSLIISKTSTARNILEMDASDLCDVMLTTKKVAAATRKALDPDGIQVAQFNGAPSGQSVFHLHFHVIPRWTQHEGGHVLHFVQQEPADNTMLAELAAQIRAAF